MSLSELPICLFSFILKSEMNKILVVEDDQNLLDTLEYNLRREDYEVIKAIDGEEAVAIARLLLTDPPEKPVIIRTILSEWFVDKLYDSVN